MGALMAIIVFVLCFLIPMSGILLYFKTEDDKLDYKYQTSCYKQGYMTCMKCRKKCSAKIYYQLLEEFEKKED